MVRHRGPDGGGTGPTNHSGEIEQDETWWPSSSPHILQSDIHTGENVTLTVKPGWIVRFNSDVELHTGCTDQGAVIAEGTAHSAILFTRNSASVARRLVRSRIPRQCRRPQPKLINCRVEFGSGGDYGNIRAHNAVPTITGCDIPLSAAWRMRLGAEHPSKDTLLACDTFSNNADGDVGP